MLFLCATLVAFAAYAQTGAGIWEGKIGGINPPPTLRVDFDSEMASINGGPSQAVAVSQAADPLDIHFQITVGGTAMRFTGRRIGSEIAGTLGTFALS